jgi:TrmH family RNA methyltransferase
VIEGPRLLGEALDARVDLVEAYAAPGADRRLWARLEEGGVSVHEVQTGVLERVGDVQTSQGWIGVAALPAGVEVERLPSGAGRPEAAAAPLVLVLMGVADPGNVGTLLRAADAAAAAAVMISPSTADPYAPKVVRAAAGALFRVPLVELVDPLDTAGRWGLITMGCVAHGGEPIYQADLVKPVALVLGSEAHGLPPAVEDRLDARVSIPMPGQAESLNVAMAGTVAIFEALRQRQSHDHVAPRAPQ